MRRRRVLKVELGGVGSLVSGPGAHEVLISLGCRPVWISTLRGFSCQETTARNAIALGERLGYSVEVQGPRSRRARLLETLLAAPAPRWPDEPDPAEGRW